MNTRRGYTKRISMSRDAGRLGTNYQMLRRALSGERALLGLRRRYDRLRASRGYHPTQLPSRIDVGLEVLLALRPRGAVFSPTQIADVCGVSEQQISNITQRAIAKLRTALAARKKEFDQ